jgi:hypothetical protein
MFRQFLSTHRLKPDPRSLNSFVEQQFQTLIQYSASLRTIVHDACQISTRVTYEPRQPLPVFGAAANFDMNRSECTGYKATRYTAQRLNAARNLLGPRVQRVSEMYKS